MSVRQTLVQPLDIGLCRQCRFAHACGPGGNTALELVVCTRGDCDNVATEPLAPLVGLGETGLPSSYQLSHLETGQKTPAWRRWWKWLAEP